jgi:hypothetical protein
MCLLGTLITQKKNFENAVMSYYEMQRKKLQNTLTKEQYFFVKGTTVKERYYIEFPVVLGLS